MPMSAMIQLEALLGDGVTCYWVYFMDPEGMLFELQEKN
jgi:hypothetical protein